MAKPLMELYQNSQLSSSSKAMISSFKSASASTPTQASQNSNYNTGDFWGGVGYTLGKLGTGAFSILEGIWDYAAGGIADFFGADDWAEEQFANNVTAQWNQGLDEWYNPDDTMKVVGDVSSGIGNSLVGVAAVAGAAAIAYFSGGSLAPWAASLIAGTVMGAGAAGSATSEAYAKTGELGAKEYGYGALTGVTEGALEGLTGAAGKVGAKIFAKETAKSVAKSSVIKGLLKDIGSDFVGEAFEEGMSEFLTPIYQRITQVDPNAQYATPQQIGYAAMVGGISGALMGGIGTGISTAKSISRGDKISKNAELTNAVVATSEKFAQYAEENGSDNASFQYVKDLVDTYKANDNGTGVLTMMQKKVLGEMERANAVLTVLPEVEKSKAKITADADRFVEYINSRHITDADTGKPFHFASGAELLKNDNLVTQFAVADALGQLMLAPTTVYDMVSSQKVNGITQEDFQNFQQNARAQEKKAVGEMFGIDVDNITYEEAMNKFKTTDSKLLEGKKGSMNARRASKQAISYAQNMNTEVKTFTKKSATVEGTNVYKTKDGKLFAVTKNGTNYYLYYDGNVSQPLSISKIIGAVQALEGVQEAQPAQTPAATQKTAQNQTMASGTENVSAESKTAQESKATQSKEKKNAEKKVKAKKGIRREDGSIVSIKELKKNAKKDTQKSAVETIAFLSKVFGTQYYVYESYENSKGERVYKDKNGNEVYAPNGYSRGVDGSIHVDLNAGEIGEGVVLNTLAHEQGHHIKRVNPEGFQLLADFIVKHYKETGVDVDGMIKDRIDLMRKRGRLQGKTSEQAYDMAYEDVICDGLETVYHDGKVVEMVAALNTTKKGKTVLQQLLEVIKKLIGKISDAYKSVGGKTDAGQAVATMSMDKMQELQQIFATALTEAETAYSYLKEAETLPDSGDINYSLRAGDKVISGTGEVKKNLVALHNLSEENLLRVLSLDGFPMPSIAITKTELPHENYGDITVVFGRETVDPKNDTRNVVYDRDAWTPTTPTVDVKLDNQKVGNLVKELQDEVGDNSTYKRDIYNFFDSKYRDYNGDYIVSEYDYTKDAFGHRAIKNSGIVAAYLSEKGVRVEPVYVEKGFSMGWASFTRKEAQDLFDFVGITKNITSDNATQEQRDAILDKYVEYQAKKKLNLIRRFKKNPNLTLEDAIESIRKDYDDGNVSQLFFMADDFFNESRPKDVYDEYATNEKMQAEVTDKQDFNNWLWDKVQGTFEKKGIDNDTEVFDRNGNRRSYEQRHFAYTAENIVKAMSKGAQEGKGGFGITAGALAAKLSKQFDSIEDINDAKEYLALVSEEDLKAFNDKTYELYDELVTEIAGKSSDFFADSSRRDDVGEILAVCAGAKPLTVENIKRVFDKETRGYNLRYKFNDKIAEQALSLFESLKHIPTTYFEAKPRRVVELNEIKNVLLPQTASNKLVEELDKRGIPHTKYTESNKRTDIIRNMDDVMFSDRDSAGNKLSKEQQFKKEINQMREGKAEISKSVDEKVNPKSLKTTKKFALSLESIEEKYKNQVKVLLLTENKGSVSIRNLVVEPEQRNKGVGQAILDDIIAYADVESKTITLTPTSEYGTKKRLISWYKKNGFVENKGKNTDFTISDTMYRLPLKNATNVKPTKTNDIRYQERSNGLDKKRSGVYNKKTPYVQWKSDAFAWVNSKNTAVGDMNSGYDSQYAYFYEAVDADNEGKATDYKVLAKIPITNQQEVDQWELEVQKNNERTHIGKNHKTIYGSTSRYRNDINQRQVHSISAVRELRSDGQSSVLYRGESRRNDNANNQRSVKTRGQIEVSSDRRRLKPIDKDYLAVVKNGYTKIAQSMVDQAAQDAGYTIKAYHGSRHVFTAFDKTKLGSNTKTETSKRWFFAADQKTANSYYPYGVMQELAKKYSWAKPEEVKQKGKLYSLYIKMVNPLVVDVKDYDYAAHRDKADAWMEFVEQAEKNGNDGIILLNAMDNQLDTSARESTVYMFREPNQAKSADVVTYDDNGNVIPLSKRFDIEQLDIRYQERKPIKGADKVMTEQPNSNVTMGDVITGKATLKDIAEETKGKASEITERSKVLLTNAQAGVERTLKESGVKDAAARTNYVRAARAAALNAIDKDGAQFSYDGNTRVGQSLGSILMPIYKANEKDGQTYADFELYLLHMHNIDRYAVGKPVFNEVSDPIEEHVTSEDSRKAVEELEKQYPEFRKIAEKVWKYCDNNLQLAVDSGLYTQEYVDELREMYPHYVPTPRESYATTEGALLGKNVTRVNNAKKMAKGSAEKILPIDDSIAAQTIQRTTSARLNGLLVDMLNANTADFEVISSEDADVDVDKDTEVTFHAEKDKNKYQITFYNNGKAVTVRTTWAIYTGIEAFRSNTDLSNNLMLAGVAKANSAFKKMVTSLNPFFSFFKNPIRDMQDALLYTKYSPIKFLKNYKRAWREIYNNGKYWQEAKAAGITSASVYDQATGIEYRKTGILEKGKRIKNKLEGAANIVEMSPRMAEYICAREAGLSVQDALLQAQDVTTNFGRGGTSAKTLNKTIMPFLNPSIQGFSKMWRAYTGENGKKAWVSLIIRSLLLGVGASWLNDILNDDEEGYEDLSDYVKEQNYLLFVGDGNYLKLPKGRVASVFGSVYLRGKRYNEGDEKAWDDWGKSVISSVTPVDNVVRTIFSPFVDVATNSTWYGGQIEGQKWDNTAPKDRYDESTSKIAIWMGQVFNYSPLRIQYLLEQYTGIVGDLVLPATSTQGNIEGIVSQNMLTNATLNSKWSSKFYDTLEEYTYKKTAGDLQAQGVVKYLTKISGTISDMQKQKQEIQNNSKLTNAEKLTEMRILQATINTLIQEALGNVNYFYEELGKYDLEDEEIFSQAYLDTVAATMGSKYALESYNKDVYAKATKLNALGIGYDDYYDIYFDLKEIKANTEGSAKKATVIKYIMSQDLPTKQKIILILSQGYSIADGDIKGVSSKSAKTAIAKYITSLNASKAEKTELAKMLGFTVENGRIYLNK